MQLIEFGSIMKLEKGKKPEKQIKHALPGYFPYVDIKAFETGKIDNFTDDKRCLPCDDNDVLIVCDGSRSGLVGKAIKGFVGSTLAKISAEGMSSDYLYYFLQGKYQLLNTRKKGTGTPHLNVEMLKKQKLILPSYDEQKQIVLKIEELFSSLDNAEKMLQQTKEQLEVYTQAVLKESFDINCEYKSLGEISDSRLGKMLDKKKNVGIPRKYLRNINVRWFEFDLSDLLTMRITDDEIERYSICKGDLVICEGGEPGRCAVWKNDESIYYQKALHRVRFKIEANPYFYMYYIWLAAMSGQLSKYYTGTGIKHLTEHSLKKVEVPVVDISKQCQIVEKIESQLSFCRNILQTVNSSLQKASALRQSILKGAFEGRFV